MSKEKLSIEYLKECLNYDQVTGVFTWKQRPRSHFKADWSFINWNKRWAGTEAGWKDKTSADKEKFYLKISVNSEDYKAHRLAWVFITGSWPNKLIDHVDGDRLNNKAINLREATDWQNSTNAKRRKDNKSGVTGVGWQKALCKWYANGRINDHLQHLGFYADIFEAICARKSWEIKNGFHINHGRG